MPSALEKKSRHAIEMKMGVRMCFQLFRTVSLYPINVDNEWSFAKNKMNQSQWPPIEPDPQRKATSWCPAKMDSFCVSTGDPCESLNRSTGPKLPNHLLSARGGSRAALARCLRWTPSHAPWTLLGLWAKSFCLLVCPATCLDSDPPRKPFLTPNWKFIISSFTPKTETLKNGA